MTRLSSLRSWMLGAAATLAMVGVESFGLTQGGWAAEKVTVKYGPFYRSVGVADLAQYASSGQATPELASLLSLVKEEEKTSLKEGLNLKFPFDVVAVDKLINSPLADGMLTQVADATILPGDVEKVALRGALLIAASSQEGLGTLSLLNSYPTPTLTIDLKKLLKLMEANKGALQGMGALMQGGGAGAPKP